MQSKWKSISKDFLYNIIASFVMIGTMQIAVYPFLAFFLEAQEYGVLLTLVGIINAICTTLANTLNNVRLIQNNRYEEEKKQGDFNLLLLIAVVIGILVTVAAGKFFFEQQTANLFGIGIYIGLMIFRTYHCVQFRIILNFKKILQANIAAAVGFLVGIALTYFFGIWSLSFVCGEVFCVVYVLLSTDLYKEGYSVTDIFPETLSKYTALIVAGIAGNFLTYLDRLIIYPLLGGEAVTTYTVASVFGKSLGIVMTPIGGVLLGYYTQKNFKMNRKMFWKINGITLGLSFAFVVVSVLAAPIVLKILYPGVYEAAEPFLFWANLAATLSVTCTLTQPAVLKCAPAWVQIIKEVIYAVVYVGVGAFMLNQFGLMGFCIAALAANLVRLLVLYVIGNVYVK